jgi:hypothetical protein
MDFIEPVFDQMHGELALAYKWASQKGWRMGMTVRRLTDAERPRQWFQMVDEHGHGLGASHGSAHAAVAGMIAPLILRDADEAENLVEILLHVGWRLEQLEDDRVALVLDQSETVHELFMDALDPDHRPVTRDGITLQPLSSYEDNLNALRPGSSAARALLDMLVRDKSLSRGERERACGLRVERGSLAEAVIAAYERVSCIRPEPVKSTA